MKRKGILGILPFLLATSGYGLTVEEAYRTVIDTNPEVRQRIEDYRAVEEDKTIAFADYLPVVDIQGSVGYKHDEGSVGSLDPNNDQDDYLHTEAFVRARENLFRGFSTMYDVAQQDARLLAAEHSLMEKVSQLGLSMIESYLGVLKQKQLLALTVENRNTHQRYYDMIKERVEAGAGTQSDMEQISGRLALAESNVKVAMNNYEDAQTSFKRIYGEAVNPDDMMEADINASLLPADIAAAEQTALLRYPTLMANRKNIEAAQAAYRQAASNYYPTVDLEVKETHVNNDRTGDYAWRTNSGDENEFTVQLIASWNLYNGGSDVAGRKKALASAFNASEKMMENQRLVFERLNYSWAAKTRIAEQIEYLKDHRDFTQKTLQAYLEEFRLGRRTLLDVLDVENEYYTSRKAYVSALYDQQLSEYRVIENVGNLPLVAEVKPDEILALKRDAMAETKVPASE
ncbi:TolC family outer membrane protein [Sulfurimonas sp. HSL-1656]|uniref:TolC family outer membrane protein n=1 Tax=Thiomicrolovo subterrani TaxID=3131934 RepID=UPI0031F7F833